MLLSLLLVLIGSDCLQVKDAELLKELGPGCGQVTIIQELLDQVSDPAVQPASPCLDFPPASLLTGAFLLFLTAVRGQTPPAATVMADTRWRLPC